MNWQHLIYFKTLAEEGSYAKTAAKLFITPPALSKAIASLESELGVKLFEHDPTGSRLTKYGSIFYDGVNIAANEINSSISTIQFDLDPQTVHLRIGTSYNALNDLIPECIRVFRDAYPGSSFDISYLPGNTIIKELACGDLDLGFCNCFEKYTDDLEKLTSVSYERLGKKQLYAVLPAGSMLIGQSSLKFGDLKDEDWIIVHGQDDYSIINDKCLEAGFTPRACLHTHDRPSSMALVAAGLGMTVLSFSDTTIPKGNFTLVPIETDYAKTEFVVWNRNNLGKANRAFVEIAKSLVSRDSTKP